jgi:hypothetical protein
MAKWSMKFCMKLGKSSIKNPSMICEAFEENSLSQTAVFEWHSCFKAILVPVEYDKRSGQPRTSKTTENVEKL